MSGEAASHGFVGLRVTADGHIRHELLVNGRYVCGSVWGLRADRRGKLLKLRAVAGARDDADLHRCAEDREDDRGADRIVVGSGEPGGVAMEFRTVGRR